jgi:hypothetical protein
MWVLCLHIADVSSFPPTHSRLLKDTKPTVSSNTFGSVPLITCGYFRCEFNIFNLWRYVTQLKSETHPPYKISFLRKFQRVIKIIA